MVYSTHFLGFLSDLHGGHTYDMRCEICLKAGMSGNNVSHSNRHTKTRFKANVHKQTLFQDGRTIKVKICSRCLRSLNKSSKVRKAVAALK